MTTTALTTDATAGGDPLLALQCPECRVSLAAERSLAGAPARCPLCRTGFTVPMPPRSRKAAAQRTGDEDLRRRGREDRSRRRARRNIVMLLAGVVLLLGIVLTLGTRRPRNRR